jgi:hypothetical protein
MKGVRKTQDFAKQGTDFDTAGSRRGSTRRVDLGPYEFGVERSESDKDEQDEDDDVPETPPDEPRPPRIEDPPPQPDTPGPYVVQAAVAAD